MRECSSKALSVEGKCTRSDFWCIGSVKPVMADLLLWMQKEMRHGLLILSGMFRGAAGIVDGSSVPEYFTEISADPSFVRHNFSKLIIMKKITLFILLLKAFHLWKLRRLSRKNGLGTETTLKHEWLFKFEFFQS